MKNLFALTLILIFSTFAVAQKPIQAPKPPQAPSIDERLTALENEVAELKKLIKPVTVPGQTIASQPKLVKGNVPGIMHEHFVDEGSPFAAPEALDTRMRRLVYNGPVVTGSICFGPNCPKK